MNRLKGAALLAGLILFASAFKAESHPALNLGACAPSSDGIYYCSLYPNGDKPPAGCSTPSGWTLASKGSGFGEVCEVSATEFDFSGGGSSASNGFRYVYKNVASGDFQLKGRVTNEYAGATGSFAGVGITISDGTADGDAIHNVFSPLGQSYVARSLAGTPGSTTNTNGVTGQSRPRYLCAAYDESETESRVFESADGSTWLPVATFDYAFSTPIVGFYVQSGSTTDTLTATINSISLTTGSSAIDCYTPNPPPGGSPVLVSAIGSLSGTQGTAFNLSCALNWTGQTPLTHPYTISGLPGGTGLTFDGTICALTGTPTASDVGSRSITITAKNSSGNTPDTFTLTIDPLSGDTFTIATGAASDFNCQTQGVGPGDTIVLAAGNHNTSRDIRNCFGNANSPITIRNDTSGGSAASLRRINTSDPFILRLENVQWLVIDGCGGYSGVPAGRLGYNYQTGALGRTQAGIKIVNTITTHPTHYVRISGASSKHIIFKCVEIDGDAGTGGGSGILLSLNDHSFNNGYSGSGTYTGEWREDITFQDNYIHNSEGNGGECMYVGPNPYEDDYPLRNITIEGNIVEFCDKNAIEMKYAIGGTNYIRHNYTNGAGIGNETGQKSGLVSQASEIKIIGNIVKGVTGNGINCNNGNSVSSSAVQGNVEPEQDANECTVQNNVIDSSGQGCINVTRVTTVDLPGTAKDGTKIQWDPVLIDSNTCISPGDGDGVSVSGVTPTPVARDNIFAGTPTPTISGATDTNNRKGSVAAQNFSDGGVNDYELSSLSGACSQASSSAPADDYEGESRPQPGADQGADEGTACP